MRALLRKPKGLLVRGLTLHVLGRAGGIGARLAVRARSGDAVNGDGDGELAQAQLADQAGLVALHLLQGHHVRLQLAQLEQDLLVTERAAQHQDVGGGDEGMAHAQHSRRRG